MKIKKKPKTENLKVCNSYNAAVRTQCNLRHNALVDQLRAASRINRPWINSRTIHGSPGHHFACVDDEYQWTMMTRGGGFCGIFRVLGQLSVLAEATLHSRCTLHFSVSGVLGWLRTTSSLLLWCLCVCSKSEFGGRDARRRVIVVIKRRSMTIRKIFIKKNNKDIKIFKKSFFFQINLMILLLFSYS